MLVPPLVEEVVTVIVVPEPEFTQKPVDLSTLVDNQLEPVEVPDLVVQFSQEGLGVPAIEEEKKTGRKAKKS